MMLTLSYTCWSCSDFVAFSVKKKELTHILQTGMSANYKIQNWNFEGI